MSANQDHWNLNVLMAGIAETYLNEIGINILLANELVKERADFSNTLSKNENDYRRYSGPKYIQRVCEIKQE